MASKQKILWGAALEASVDGGTTWLRVAESSGIAVQAEETEYVDVTSLDSPAGRREFIPGIVDPGTTEIQVGYVPETYEMLIGWKAAGEIVQFRSTLPLYGAQTSGDVFACSGYVNPQVVETDDVSQPLKINLGIRFSGAMTYTKGS